MQIKLFWPTPKYLRLKTDMDTKKHEWYGHKEHPESKPHFAAQ